MTSWLDILGPIIRPRPLGGIDELHIDNDVNSRVDEAHDIAKQIDKMTKRLTQLKHGLRKDGVGEHVGFDSIASVFEDEEVKDALNSQLVKGFLFDLLTNGDINGPQYSACFKKPSMRKGKVTFKSRDD